MQAKQIGLFAIAHHFCNFFQTFRNRIIFCHVLRAVMIQTAQTRLPLQLNDPKGHFF